MKNIDNYFEHLENLITEHKENIIDIIHSKEHYNTVKVLLNRIEDRILELHTLTHQIQYSIFIVNRIEYNLITLCKKYNIQPPYIERDNKNDPYYWYVIDIGKFIDKIVTIFDLIDIDIVPLLEINIGYIPNPNYAEYEDDNTSDIENNDLNKSFTKQFSSIMTQAQLSTMFRLFRDKGIIDKRMNDTQLGRFIQLIAGGGLKRTKDYLGRGYSESINTTLTKTEQANQIQDILQELIQQIENEKQDILE